jgi:hypothetical protein
LLKAISQKNIFNEEKGAGNACKRGFMRLYVGITTALMMRLG